MFRFPGQLRVGGRICDSIRCDICRLRDAGALPEGVCQISCQGKIFRVLFCAVFLTLFLLQWFQGHLESGEEHEFYKPHTVAQPAGFIGE